MKTRIKVLGSYFLFGFVGPVLSLVQDYSDFLASLASHLWLTWGLATMEHSVGSAIATLFAVGANLIFYMAVGGLASISRRIYWNVLVLFLIAGLTISFSYLMHGLELSSIAITLALHGIILWMNLKQTGSG